MRIVKSTILGVAIAGFTAGSALACGYDKTASVKMTPKPIAKVTLMQPLKPATDVAVSTAVAEATKLVTLTTEKTPK
jgi:hypothetical protein